MFKDIIIANIAITPWFIIIFKNWSLIVLIEETCLMAHNLN